MASLAVPVREYMSSPVLTVEESQPLSAVASTLHKAKISAVAVVDGAGKLTGVVSRTDLLSHGAVSRARSNGGTELDLPDKKVADVMAREPISVSEEASIQAAAQIMVKGHFHRVFVEKAGKLCGVLSTRDVMSALVDKGVKTPISELATKSLVKVQAADPLSLVLDRMEKAHKHGLIVVDQSWPVGIFAQDEALEAQSAAPSTPVEEFMNLSILMLPGNLSVSRAAAQANALRVRRVLVMDDGGMRGILSGIDFARAAV